MFSGINTDNKISFIFTPNGADRLGLGILNKTSPRERVAGPESFQFFAISLILRGKGSYEDCITGKRYPLQAGSFFMRQPGVEHIIRVDTSSNWQEWFINLGNFAWPYFKNYFNLSEDIPVGNFTPNENWLNDFQQLLNELQNSQEEQLSKIFFRLFGLASEVTKGVKQLEGDEEIVHEACVYLCTDFSKPKDIKEFCRHHSCGYEKFRKVFTRQMGISPNRYRIQRRMDTACALLRQKELSIKIISNSLGYCSQYEFSAKFKTFFGIPPTTFRKQQNKDSSFSALIINR